MKSKVVSPAEQQPLTFGQKAEIVYNRLLKCVGAALVAGVIFGLANPLAGVCAASLAAIWAWIVDVEG